MPHALLDDVLAVTKPDLLALTGVLRDQFLQDYGSWVVSGHRARLESLFSTCAQVRLQLLSARSATEALELQETYDTLVASVETLGLALQIIADAEARKLLVAGFRRAQELVPVVAGVVLKAVLPLIPGAAVAGPIAGAGVEALLKEIMS